jgi:hypothetical protein
VLEDGEYDAFIVWADDERGDARIELQLAITLSK